MDSLRANDVAIGLPLIVLWSRSGNDRDSRTRAGGHLPFRSPPAPLRLAGVRFWRDVAIVSGATVLAVTAHFVEVTIWAFVFVFCGEFAQFGGAFYHSAMNYTTLGYGDVIMSPSWRLFGPLEAADGMLMFGMSTAIVISVIQLIFRTRFHDLPDL